MKPISIADLPSNPDVLPPKLCKLRGWPKTKRVRKNAWNRQKRKCGSCRQLGHNTRRCTSLPVAKNGRGERARDWQTIEVNESNSDTITVDTGN